MQDNEIKKENKNFEEEVKMVEVVSEKTGEILSVSEEETVEVEDENGETFYVLKEEAEASDKYAKCADCGRWYMVDEMDEVYGEHYCNNCFNENFVVCTDCGEVVARDDAYYIDRYEDFVCQSCLDSDYGYCDRCECYEPNDRLCTVYTDADKSGYVTWCEDCCDQYAYRCEVCDDYFNFDVGVCNCCCDDGSEYDDGGSGIHDYCYKPSPVFYGECDDNLYMGIELETDKGSGCNDTCRQVTAEVPEVYGKHDGSLNNGVEYVSYPATLSYHINNLKWQRLMEICAANGFKSHDAGTCGLHVHVSRKFFGATEDEQDGNIAKLILIFNRFWSSHIVPFTRRKESQLADWARKSSDFDDFHTKETMSSLKEKIDRQKTGSHGSRYCAINMQNSNTVEFRIFRGTLKWSTFKATLEWVDSVCRCAKNTKLRDINSLTWEDTLPKDKSPELAAYLESLASKFNAASVVTPIRTARPEDIAVFNYDNELIAAGTKVRIKDYETLAKENELYEGDLLCDRYKFTEEMKAFCGKVFTVKSASIDGAVFFEEPEVAEYGFSEAMFVKEGEVEGAEPVVIDYEKVDLDI